jgi:trans-aconitate 2-methyltransferase
VTAADRWDPDQYNRFADEREQPFWDLAALLAPVEAPALVDLGCGDGRLTAALHRVLMASSTLGLDSSAAMIDAAADHAGSGVSYVQRDVSSWEEAGRYDVVFSNAALHWLPDHPAVLARWARSLTPTGQLAVQVPANADHPAHRIAGAVAAEMLEEPPPDPVAHNVLAPETYATLLWELGFTAQTVRLQVYPHLLESTAAIVEWVKGSTLTRFKEPLGPDGWNAYVERYRARLLHELGDRSPCFYPFKRILLWGRRG